MIYTHCSICGKEFAPHTVGFREGAKVSHMKCAERAVVAARFEHHELLRHIDSKADSLELGYEEVFADNDIHYLVFRECDDVELIVCDDLIDLYLYLHKP